MTFSKSKGSFEKNGIKVRLTPKTANNDYGIYAVEDEKYNILYYIICKGDDCSDEHYATFEEAEKKFPFLLNEIIEKKEKPIKR
ncbi:MAG: hypothetical protein EVG15_10790 [Candidatus Acididesulfobacter diazotrophicus]|jgi:hypothetical protein|uniref:Uncharacterized protein n=1 Tax=Candidatus Acididesulfobacter diazotrophicus TaxID=2597226 RepID=A0A519BJQ5_9DELT|nr:MAG: hypothetical protein EVG15_10790 [Candidatus Acididesulfobacter diazotrophicus]